MASSDGTLDGVTSEQLRKAAQSAMDRLRQQEAATDAPPPEANRPADPPPGSDRVPGSVGSVLDGLGARSLKAWLARQFARIDRIDRWLRCSSVTWVFNLPVSKGRAACLEAFRSVAHVPDDRENGAGRSRLSVFRAARAIAIGVPAALVLWPLTLPLTLGASLGSRAFRRMAFRKDAGGHRTLIAPKRMAGAIVLALVVGYGAIFQFLPFYYVNVAAFAHDAVAINLFRHRDVLVFGQANEVEGRPDVYAVPACFASPCEAQENTVQFRMRDSVYLDVLRLMDSFLSLDISNTDIGELHDPAELAGAFLSGKSACYVEYYGRRHKTLGLYPHIIDATCEDIEDGNTDAALERLRGQYLGPEAQTTPVSP